MSVSVGYLAAGHAGRVRAPAPHQGILLYAGDDAPLDGIDELLVALHDIRNILSRPALERLAKIEGVAEEVADGAPTASSPGCPRRAHWPHRSQGAVPRNHHDVMR